MTARALRSPATIWLVLVVATLLSYASWHDLSWADPRLGGSAVILIAFVKARLIGLHFMELRDAVWPLRLMFEAWVAIVGIVLLVMFWIPG